jgi:hypothetical protein
MKFLWLRAQSIRGFYKVFLIFSTRKIPVPGEDAMDILYIALMIGFVALSIGLTYFFETLRRPK